MSDKFKNCKFYQKLKSIHISRAVYITVICVILALTIVIAVTIAANRARKTRGNEDVTTSGDNTVTTPNEGTTKGNTEKQTENTTDDSKQTLGEVPKLSLPVSGIITKGHDATIQVYSTTMDDYRVHLGLDISTSENAPVYSAADGKVAQIWEDPMMGYCVALSHNGECFTIYKNLAKDLAEGIEVGAGVSAGQLIGAVGDSAMIESAEEPHLHFEMTVAGLSVDPLEYFDENAVASLSEDIGYEDSTENGSVK